MFIIYLDKASILKLFSLKLDDIIVALTLQGKHIIGKPVIPTHPILTAILFGELDSKSLILLFFINY